ncbi:ion channel [Nocardioides sp. DS6]|uniref:Ion channel n=1 Tax=Nocardioides eburneus TaxID=3231482 RepID=A0ABV3SVS6_9ACTN
MISRRAPALWAVRTHPNAVLLVAQLAVVVGYPFLGNSTAGRAIVGVLQLVAVFSAVGVVRRSPAVTWLAFLLGPPAMTFAVWESVDPSRHWVILISAALHVPFYLFVSYGLIRYLFHDQVVTRDELFATAAAFTVVAWAFAYAYAAVQVLWPGSFGDARPWYDLLFLSFTTLTNTGLGDFGPVLSHARSVVVLEQVAGVFYVALVVSRLVGLAINRARS